MAIVRVPPSGVRVATAEEISAFHVPQPPPHGWVYDEDVPYAETPRPLTAYVYRPIDTSELRPAVVFVHGGAWVGGHPFFHIRQAADLAQFGYVTACIFYRLAGEAPYPAAMEDATAAVHWMRTQPGVDPDRVTIAGGSTGAHIGLLVALTQPEAVNAAMLWYPPTDMRMPGISDAKREHLRPHVEEFLAGTPPLDASPVSYVTSACPPVLTLVGDADDNIPLPAVYDFHAKLDAAGVPNDLVVYEGRNHAFDWDPTDWADSAERVRDWLATAPRTSPTR